jgi:hypothetical protein
LRSSMELGAAFSAFRERTMSRPLCAPDVSNVRNYTSSNAPTQD